MSKNLQKSGLQSHFAVSLRILLQICYKRLKEGLKISNHSLTSWTFEHHPR